MVVDLAEQLRVLGYLAWALGLGMLIGFERDWANKPAGMRTHALVAVAAAVVTAVSAAAVSSSGIGDPSRGLHAVITGIGFLGAGAILQPKKDRTIVGLTTAGSIMWAAAAGGAVALGYGLAATGGTLLVLLVLSSIGWYKHGRNANGDGESGDD